MVPSAWKMAFSGLLSGATSPVAFSLKGRGAIAQFVALHKCWQYNTFDVAHEISANRKAVFLNWLFWSRHDFSKCGINQEQRESLLGHLKQCWELSHTEVSLPASDERQERRGRGVAGRLTAPEPLKRGNRPVTRELLILREQAGTGPPGFAANISEPINGGEWKSTQRTAAMQARSPRGTRRQCS
jgi:hypothetical protein